MYNYPKFDLFILKVEVKRVETQNGRQSGQGNQWPQSTKVNFFSFLE